MVSLKALRNIVGISGLTLIAFAGGAAYMKGIYQTKLFEQMSVSYTSQINLEAEYNHNQKILKSEVKEKLGEFRENIFIYRLIDEDLSINNYNLAIDDLEGVMLRELHDMEDYVLSLEKRNFSPEVIANANKSFRELNDETRACMNLYKLRREEGRILVREPWNSPRLRNK